MNPNGQNQRWSMWYFTVRWPGKGVSMPVTRSVMQREFSKWVKKVFNSTAGQAHIQVIRGHIIFKLMIEGTDITPTDPAYVAWVQLQADGFFKLAFGESTVVKTKGRLLAGSPQTGAPSDQLIVLPPLDIRLKDLNISKGE